MTTLTGPRAAPKSGVTRSLVILLHGYGADGNDLFGLSGALADHMPDTAFRAPNAPEKCGVNPMGYHWFPIPWLDGSTEEQSKAGFQKAAETLDAYLTDAMAEEGVTSAQTVVVGFSQGTMMSLHVAPRRAEPVAGIVGFSGRLLDKDMADGDTLVHPPVLLIHGDADEMIPVQEMSEAETALRAAGFMVASHISQGIGHGIAPDGLGLALRFMVEKLGITQG